MSSVPATPWLEMADVAVRFPIRRGVLARVQGHVHAVAGVSLTMATSEAA